MRKFSGIVFICIFLSACGTTSSNMKKGKVKIGMSKEDFCLAVSSFRFSQDPCSGTFMEGYNNTARGMYYPVTKNEIMHDLKKEYFFIFENVNTPFNYRSFKAGDGTLVRIFQNYDKAKSFASNIKFELKNENIKIAKQKCKDLFAKPETQEFADCTLKQILELSK